MAIVEFCHLVFCIYYWHEYTTWNYFGVTSCFCSPRKTVILLANKTNFKWYFDTQIVWKFKKPHTNQCPSTEKIALFLLKLCTQIIHNKNVSKIQHSWNNGSWMYYVLFNVKQSRLEYRIYFSKIKSNTYSLFHHYICT